MPLAGVGGQGNSLQNSSSATATSGPATSGTSTGNKVVNFNAPGARLTDGNAGKALAAGVLVVVLILGAIWLKGQQKG